MGKLTCRCGTVLSNSGDHLRPYRADLLPEVHLEAWATAELAQLQALITAIQNGQSVNDFVGGTPHQLVADTLLTWKISGSTFHDFSREVYQCPTCGRLLVETAQRNHFRTFLPESDDTLGILDA